MSLLGNGEGLVVGEEVRGGGRPRMDDRKVGVMGAGEKILYRFSLREVVRRVEMLKKGRGGEGVLGLGGRVVRIVEGVREEGGRLNARGERR